MGVVYRPVNKKRDYKQGLSGLRIPSEEIARISQGLVEGRLPRDILDTVITNAARIEELHPDAYPWGACDDDDIYYGLKDAGIQSERVWQDATAYVRQKFDRGMPRVCDVGSGFEAALSNLFEIYALAKYHDVSVLRKQPQVAPFR